MTWGAITRFFALALTLTWAAACSQTTERNAPAREAPTYQPVETRLLDKDLVQFVLAMQGARDRDDLSAFADCAAAQYAVIRGFGFAQHVRTNVSEAGGLWRADAVYTISAAIPRGVKTLDAEVTLAACREAGIPSL